MIILVEGPDGAGKTTYCKTLFDKLKGPIKYEHVGKVDDVNEYYSSLIRRIKKYKKENYNLILDRGILSNIIYTKLFETQGRVKERLQDEVIFLIDEIIICLDEDKNEYLKRFSKLKNEREEKYSEMSNVYDEYLKISKWDKIKDKVFVVDVFKKEGK